MTRKFPVPDEIADMYSDEMDDMSEIVGEKLCDLQHECFNEIFESEHADRIFKISLQDAVKNVFKSGYWDADRTGDVADEVIIALAFMYEETKREFSLPASAAKHVFYEA